MPLDEYGMGTPDLVDAPPLETEPPPQEFPGEEQDDETPTQPVGSAPQAIQRMETDDAG